MGARLALQTPPILAQAPPSPGSAAFDNSGLVRLFVQGKTLESGAAQQWNWLCANRELQEAAQEEAVTLRRGGRLQVLLLWMVNYRDQ